MPQGAWHKTRTMADAATSMTIMTYVQAAAQTHAVVEREKKEKGKERERGPNTPKIAAQVTTSLPYLLERHELL